MDLEDLPKKPPTVTIGENLDLLAVVELEQRVHDLESEILRVRSMIVSKQASKSAADAFFKA